MCSTSRTLTDRSSGSVSKADSAPANFRPGRLALRATVLAAVLCGLYVANYVHGWIGAEDLNLFGEPTGRD